MPDQAMTRRDVLAGAASALPAWFLARTGEAAEPTAIPKAQNESIQIGVIGPGGSRGGYRQGLGVSRYMHSRPGAQVTAVCDVDAVHAKEAQDQFEGSRAYGDYRQMLAKEDLDAVVIGTPDHWHELIAIAAMEKGLDVYCEKPLTLTIAEGRRIADVAKKTGRIFQVGSQQRSDGRFRLACSLVRHGRLGEIKDVKTVLPFGPTGGPFEVIPVAEGLDWNMWQGPAPDADYVKERCHGSFRWWHEYSGGMLTDWGAHHHDIAQWGLGMDHSGPIGVRATGTPQPHIGPHSYSTFPTFEVEFHYANGVRMLSTSEGENGVTFTGGDGWIFVNRERIAASDPKLLEEPLPADKPLLGNDDGHANSFLIGVRERRECVCPAEVGHRSATTCHMANISLKLGGRELAWSPRVERFDDEQANQMMDRPHRDWE